MIDKRREHMIIAMCIGWALIAFAIYQRHYPVNIPTSAFFAAAALICVLAEVHSFRRHKVCRGKSVS